jgi:hypothetical protein
MLPVKHHFRKMNRIHVHKISIMLFILQ